MAKSRRIEDFLLEMRLVAQAELQFAMEEAKSEHLPLIQVLVRSNLVDDVQLARLLSAQLNLNRIDLDKRTIDTSAVAMLPAAKARRLRAIPVGLKKTGEGDFLYLAMSDPSEHVVSEVRKAAGKEIVPLIAAESSIERALRRHYTAEELAITLDEDLPVVMGALDGPPVEAGFLTPSTEVGLELYSKHPLRGPKGVVPSEMSAGDDDEWLTVATEEVLEIYSPAATDDSNIGTEDEDWLRDKAAGSGGFESPHTVEEEIPAGARVGRPEPACLVCADANLRTMLRGALNDSVPDLHDTEHLSEALALVKADRVRNVVLLYPRNDPDVAMDLRKLQQRQPRPGVLVISRHRGFDVMGAVTLRIPPPKSVKQLPSVLSAALKDLLAD